VTPSSAVAPRCGCSAWPPDASTNARSTGDALWTISRHSFRSSGADGADAGGGGGAATAPRRLFSPPPAASEGAGLGGVFVVKARFHGFARMTFRARVTSPASTVATRRRRSREGSNFDVRVG
jgi:hypothetical protein